VLRHIFSFLHDKDIPVLLTVNKAFSQLLLGRWKIAVEYSSGLQRQRRNFYHKRSRILSVVYDSIEKAHVKKFIGFNSMLGVQAYTVTQLGMNIFVRVRPCALGHTAGVVYTWTRWKDEHIAEGWWVMNSNDEEIWRINIGYNESCQNLWFSVFVRDTSGQEAWDSNNGWNYSLNLFDAPSTTYEQTHNAVIQYHESQKKQNYYDYDENCEELWLNVDHVSCC